MNAPMILHYRTEPKLTERSDLSLRHLSLATGLDVLGAIGAAGLVANGVGPVFPDHALPADTTPEAFGECARGWVDAAGGTA